LINEKVKNLAVAGGGTGGHIFPALAIAMELQRLMPEIGIKYLGKKDSLEEKLVANHDWQFIPIPARPLKRKLSLSNLLIPFTLMSGSRLTKAIIKNHRIDGLLGTGGYVSVPALMGARKARVKIFLQEQNSFPGIATRLFAKHADLCFLSYPQAGKYLASESKFFEVGNPLRPGFAIAKQDEGLKFFGLRQDKKTLLIFGGSQGAEALNQKVKSSLGDFGKDGRIQLIWQAGKYNFDFYKSAFEQSGISGVILEFIDRMEMAYAAADLAFCRSGALSLSELAAVGLPSLLIPYPYAAEDHQYHNARVYDEAGAARVIRQTELGQFNLYEYVSGLFSDPERLKKMSEAAGSLADPDASRKIAEKIIEVLKW
jgi:UDP-N-acetylglucosamine--N-acetylmuramyl-(pentapeptide) pyrophosphoryl-undecaprenol N-acetylglucosamine transferase